jgi:hypothetical protein
MKNAGRSMSGDARSAMQDLVDHGAMRARHGPADSVS